MIRWLSKAVHLVVGVTASLVFVGIGVHMVVDPLRDHLIFSRATGFLSISIGCYNFWLTKRDL